MTRLVYQRLADPVFRRRLTALAPDGTRPIIVALRDDLMRNLVEKLHHAGGAANVVVPALNGFVVVAMLDDPSNDEPSDSEAQALSADCTVGVLIERLHIDEGTARYRLASDSGHPHAQGGRAKVVALAG
ncbi:MAG: hypothetical protein M3O70_20000 [Actinomycetota bacterium]|nr:hypothetical protein [Actinomycetota bacterium]